MALIDQFLKFDTQNKIKSVYDTSEEIATLPNGSTIHRVQKHGHSCEFQLFLKNPDDYQKIKNSNLEGLWKAHFYGGNYIYLPPSSHLIIDICKFMNWKNEHFKN